MRLPREILQRISSRRSALLFEAALKGQPVDAEEAQRRAVAEIASDERSKRGFILETPENHAVVLERFLGKLRLMGERMLIAGGILPEGSSQAERDAYELFVAGKVEPISAAPVVEPEPVAEQPSASKPSVKKTKPPDPSVPPDSESAGPLLYLGGARS